MDKVKTKTVVLGLRENLTQFGLLVLVNAFVGGMVGLERTVLPLIAEQDFGLTSKSAILSFIVSFGIVKALTNLITGRYSEVVGRKNLLVLGWLVGLPVPWLIIWAPSWGWVTVANVLLGMNQGLCWSTTVIMKIDLVGSIRRGFAMGLNEFAGYIAVSLAALASGYLASLYGLRPVPFYLGIGFAVLGLVLSILFVCDTTEHARTETKNRSATQSLSGEALSFWEVFQKSSWGDRNLFSCSQAGLVNNLNDGMAWGLFPLFFASAGIDVNRIGILAAVYPAVWGLAQLITGGLSDLWGRKWLISAGMWIQAVGIWLIVATRDFQPWTAGMILLGLGTAFVYPTLLAAIGDVAHPTWRASAVGVYRMWRDLGYAIGALMTGIVADLLGLSSAISLVALVTFASGVIVAFRMQETSHRILK
ncbi:MFS transporter [Scytonema sp. NUACC26]|uniref:MFS transporter n=1 Tax=Scytonema sp. NUACC26 TaxID=3140176 RepID=UPI0034DC10FD